MADNDPGQRRKELARNLADLHYESLFLRKIGIQRFADRCGLTAGGVRLWMDRHGHAQITTQVIIAMRRDIEELDGR